MDEAMRLLREALSKGPSAVGKVQFIAGRGPADLLTLRASRALAAADILAADPDADAEVLAMSRRDAEWMLVADATPTRIIALAQSGLRVVRVICGPVPQGDLQAIAAAGVAVEVLLAAPAS
jgi:precorrin-2 dehydrogenase/sirohydrochlorin ferrochelatase